METQLEQLRQQLAAANARIGELEAVNRRWYNAAMKHYPLNWAVDPDNPELVIGNIVRNIDDGHRALLAEAHKTIAACKAAGFVTEHGEVRRVLGTLPITADGCVAGMGCELWADFNPPGINAPTQCTGPGWPCVPMTRLYGSREAAEAAKGGREG